MTDLVRLAEPQLLFGFGQTSCYAREGLSFFGPLVQPSQATLNLGFVGTREGLTKTERFLKTLALPRRLGQLKRPRLPYPGFEAIFGTSLPDRFQVVRLFDNAELERDLSIPERGQRIGKAVDRYFNAISEARRVEDTAVDLWLVHVPSTLYEHGRPKSSALKRDDLYVPAFIPPKRMHEYAAGQMPLGLFDEDTALIDTRRYRPDFHHQLKFRLLTPQVPVQLVRDETLDFVLNCGATADDAEVSHANDIAWNLSTTLFYKACGMPWKLAALRPGVCYVGLVFKRTWQREEDSPYACCAAQMFLDSGDGIVFRGALGPWYSPKTEQFHLNESAARDLVTTAVDGYKQRFGSFPSELFIHGRAPFADEEWEGFQSAVPPETHIVGVRIRDSAGLRLYTWTDNVALRGLALMMDDRHAVLQSSGWIPRLQTYPGREIPIPLSVDVLRGDADIQTVLGDVLALTKLNYNACLYSDGRPVTLKFADSIGTILTAGPNTPPPPLPFKFYI